MAGTPDMDLGRLDRDLICRHCEYNLRGLPLDGTCPECGNLVGDTLRAENRPQLPFGYRLARLSLLTCTTAGACLSMAACLFQAQHPRHLYYLWGDVARVAAPFSGIAATLALCLLLASPLARRDRIVWACLLASLLAACGSFDVLGRARE